MKFSMLLKNTLIFCMSSSAAAVAQEVKSLEANEQNCKNITAISTFLSEDLANVFKVSPRSRFEVAKSTYVHISDPKEQRLPNNFASKDKKRYDQELIDYCKWHRSNRGSNYIREAGNCYGDYVFTGDSSIAPIKPSICSPNYTQEFDGERLREGIGWEKKWSPSTDDKRCYDIKMSRKVGYCYTTIYTERGTCNIQAFPAKQGKIIFAYTNVRGTNPCR